MPKSFDEMTAAERRCPFLTCETSTLSFYLLDQDVSVDVAFKRDAGIPYVEALEMTATIDGAPVVELIKPGSILWATFIREIDDHNMLEAASSDPNAEHRLSVFETLGARRAA